MTASELNRKLLFYGFNDMTEFLKNSPLNRYIYKQMLACRDSGTIETPVLTLFNELYFQCVRVGFDINPGDAIMRRYIEEEIWWLKSREAGMVVFSFVWLILKMKRTLSFNEECFLEHLTPILMKTPKNKNGLEAMHQEMKEKDIKVPDQFTPMVYPVVKAIPMQSSDNKLVLKKIASYYKRAAQDFINYIRVVNEYQPNPNAWMELTDNYSHAWIEKYVKLYSDKDDRLALLDRIEYSIPWNERKKHENFFIGLRVHIDSGNVVYRVVRDEEVDSDHDWIEVESFGLKEAINPYVNELKNLVDQYKEERNAALKQCEELKASHELELAHIEAQHHAELRQQAVEHGYTTGKIEELEKALEKAREAQSEPSLAIKEMVAHVKSRFSKSAAEEFCTMYYHLALEQGGIDEATAKFVDGIVPYIINRDKPQQIVDITTAHQVYVSPQNVTNITKVNVPPRSKT